MKRSLITPFLIASLISLLVASGCGSEENGTVATGERQADAAVTAGGTATYEVTFDTTWSEQTHPQDFLDDPHFSGLIGAVHNEHVTFWQEGLEASPGIKNMAETGSKDPLNEEIDAALAEGTALARLSGEGINPSPGRVSLTFQVDEEHPFVTLVSMIAPSPDWFVGVDTLSLREGGKWMDELVVELPPYDAGTDNGVSYGSPDEATEPPQPVSRILAGVLTKDGKVSPLGTFTFTRLS